MSSTPALRCSCATPARSCCRGSRRRVPLCSSARWSTAPPRAWVVRTACMPSRPRSGSSCSAGSSSSTALMRASRRLLMACPLASCRAPSARTATSTRGSRIRCSPRSASASSRPPRRSCAAIAMPRTSARSRSRAARSTASRPSSATCSAARCARPRSRSARVRRARRPCRTRRTRSPASASPAWRACCAATPSSAWRTCRSGTSATSRTHLPSVSCSPTRRSCSTTCWPSSRGSSRASSCAPSACVRTSMPRRACRSLAACCSRSLKRACRARTPM